MSVNIKTENGLLKTAGKVNSFPVSKISSSDYLEDSPIGTVISFMGTTAPAHYLVCDGTVYNIADYSDLADFIQTQFGSKNYFGGNGTTTFAVPDLDNEFEDSISCIKYESTYFMQITDVGYSTSEVYTGKTWIDGKPIYRKVIQSTTNDSSETKFIPIGANIDSCVTLNCFLNDGFGLRLPAYSDNSSKQARFRAYVSTNEHEVTPNGISIQTDFVNWQNRQVIAIIEYTKTTD